MVSRTSRSSQREVSFALTYGAIFADGAPVFGFACRVDPCELADGLARAFGNHRAARI